MLTDKQRRDVAHAHYVIHHDTVMDVLHMLRDNTTDIIPKAAEAVVPAWKVAAVKVFSSSNDRLLADSSIDDIHDSSLRAL